MLSLHVDKFCIGCTKTPERLLRAGSPSRGPPPPAYTVAWSGFPAQLHLYGCKDLQQQKSLGKLHATTQHQSLPLPDALALAPDRLCPPPRTLPHHRDEPQRPFLGTYGQGHRRESVRAEERVKEVSYVVRRWISVYKGRWITQIYVLSISVIRAICV